MVFSVQWSTEHNLHCKWQISNIFCCVVVLACSADLKCSLTMQFWHTFVVIFAILHFVYMNFSFLTLKLKLSPFTNPLVVVANLYD